MGLIESGGIMVEVSKVFSFLRDLYGSFPTVIKLVIYCTFGSVILIGILRGAGR